MRAAILLALGAIACAPVQMPEGGGDPIRVCDPSPLSRLVGRPWSDALRPRALRLSGARFARVIRPGSMVTMDYRGDRLNVHLNQRGRIDRFDCG